MPSSDINSYSQKPCEEQSCQRTDPITFFCVHCDSHYCETCWPLQNPHKPEKRGPDGLQHEKMNLLIVERYRSILEPSSTPQEQNDLHREDEDTTWFGVGRDHADESVFEDHGRYATLMAQTLSNKYSLRYPQLISFIGQTGQFSERGPDYRLTCFRSRKEYAGQDAH